MRNIQLFKLKQKFEQNSLKDISSTIEEEFRTLKGLIKPEAEIAIAVGSRGIDHLVTVVKEVAENIKKIGAKPFIVPAMGSHGGATGQEQEQILHDYGVSEDTIGAPVRSSMETVEINNPGSPNRVFMDKNAFQSDGVILINKIKPHTDFRGRYESGLVKMAVIGLGKEKGASELHSFGVRGLVDYLDPSATSIINTGKVIGGMAIVENAYDKIMTIKALRFDEILIKEPGLLELAKRNRPAFPVDNIDILIIDRMGKNISGVGMDTNIIGRLKISGQPELSSPVIHSIIVTDLTEESHGNATGIGLADVITSRLYNKIDFDITGKNIVTSGFLERGKIPLTAVNDYEAFEYAKRNCGYIPPGEERIIRILDTLHLDEIYVSEKIRSEISEVSRYEVSRSPVDQFNNNGDLTPFQRAE